ncbi:DUF554 domain-containing protein [Anoxynatronum buryatiense]|uniref:DUF554 domain-containing protein n=1 Tax=Anoxynatronum buryatiense TaxID=489973 RepID=A0AA45WY46_9CLOT|nr:DUF554 domain-containing protein [Anoxynatronum buryatiense]SMP67171.1 hypothetical protein SAMN06296020_11510 [Anoxynatronum buryatiense]
MFGTIVNSLAILLGGCLGLLFQKGIADRFKNTVMQALGLSVLMIGMSGALKSENILLLIFSLVVGSLVGEALKVEDKLTAFGKWMEARSGRGEGQVARGFVATSLIYCVGAMAIVGALESGLTGNHETLYAKSLLDGVSAVIFASTLGVGVLLSALSVLVYQGAITLAAGALAVVLVDAVILEMSAIGGLLIVGIAVNILEIKRIPVGNMLPAVFVPLFYPVVEPFLTKLVQFLQTLF